MECDRHIMDSQDKIEAIRVFKYRWVVMLIFVLVAIINFMQLLQFSIIANIIVKFYGVKEYYVDLSSEVFFISYILFFYPVCYFIEKHSLKSTVLVASGLTLAGNLLKLLTTTPNRFWLVILAQFLISVGQVQISSLPSKVATTWFGSEQVSTACALVVLGMQLGSALGCVQSPFMITGEGQEEISEELFSMFLYQSIATAIIFTIVLIFFRSKPQMPPSQSQLSLISNQDDINGIPFLGYMKQISKNGNFWFVVFSLGLANGVWNSFGVLINSVYLNYFPDGANDAGIIALVAIITGGCIGSMSFGLILDKTHRFKQVSFIILALSALSFVLVVVSLVEKCRIATFITIPIFGFFIAPVLIVGFEYLVEITYPIPEACSSSAFNAAYFFLSIVATLLFQTLIGAFGYMWTFIVVFFILAFCAMSILMINSELRRRNANLAE